MHPDDVVSARHYDGLCVGLAARGWDVTAMPSNRGCRSETAPYPLRESWRGISIRRIWRPPFPQPTPLGRILNAACLIGAWSVRALLPTRRPDVVIIGTDPLFSVLTAIPCRLRSRRTRVIHWCFDLHPEASIAEGAFGERAPVVRVVRALLRRAYASCDALVDLGPCMRRRLAAYGHHARTETMTPWALVEPPEPAVPDVETRRALFGDARLALLYSGNFGRAHDAGALLDLARRLRDKGIRFAFNVRGNSAKSLRDAIRPEDTNIRLAPFVSEQALDRHLGAADIHMVSLRPEWSGTVVPSKFFGSLAVGRPVLFAGPRDSAIAEWIEKHRVGWVLDRESINDVMSALRQLAGKNAELVEMQRRCHTVYRDLFSRRIVLDRWDSMLRDLIRRS